MYNSSQRPRLTERARQKRKQWFINKLSITNSVVGTIPSSQTAGHFVLRKEPPALARSCQGKCCSACTHLHPRRRLRRTERKQERPHTCWHQPSKERRIQEYPPVPFAMVRLHVVLRPTCICARHTRELQKLLQHRSALRIDLTYTFTS